MATYSISVLSTSGTGNGYRFSGNDRNGTINSSTSNPTININAGDTINFTFSNSTSHPFTIGGTTISGESATGGYYSTPTSDSYTFSSAMTYTYVCNVHSSMTGSIIAASSSGTTTTTTAAPTTTTTTTTTATTAAPTTTTTTTTTASPTTTTTTTTAAPDGTATTTTTASPSLTTTTTTTITTTTAPISQSDTGWNIVVRRPAQYVNEDYACLFWVDEISDAYITDVTMQLKKVKPIEISGLSGLRGSDLRFRYVDWLELAPDDPNATPSDPTREYKMGYLDTPKVTFTQTKIPEGTIPSSFSSAIPEAETLTLTRDPHNIISAKAQRSLRYYSVNWSATTINDAVRLISDDDTGELVEEDWQVKHSFSLDYNQFPYNIPAVSPQNNRYGPDGQPVLIDYAPFPYEGYGPQGGNASYVAASISMTPWHVRNAVQNTVSRHTTYRIGEIAAIQAGRDAFAAMVDTPLSTLNFSDGEGEFGGKFMCRLDGDVFRLTWSVPKVKAFLYDYSNATWYPDNAPSWVNQIDAETERYDLYGYAFEYKRQDDNAWSAFYEITEDVTLPGLHPTKGSWLNNHYPFQTQGGDDDYGPNQTCLKGAQGREYLSNEHLNIDFLTFGDLAKEFQHKIFADDNIDPDTKYFMQVSGGGYEFPVTKPFKTRCRAIYRNVRYTVGDVQRRILPDGTIQNRPRVEETLIYSDPSTETVNTAWIPGGIAGVGVLVENFYAGFNGPAHRTSDVGIAVNYYEPDNTVGGDGYFFGVGES